MDIEVSGESGIEKNVNGIVLKNEFETERETIRVKRSIIFWLFNRLRTIIVTRLICNEGTIPDIKPNSIPKNNEIIMFSIKYMI